MLAVLLSGPVLLAPQAAAAQEVEDLSSLSIEELARLPVSSASKRPEPLSSAPTALYLITGDEIARSAATSLPEALRLAPNLGVQELNGHEYAITARGFNSQETANKLLVLMDGRSIYSTLHSGVFWNLRSPLLEDIAQIEVISGPGGTLYGPNAVNGVINIVSKDAGDTLGGLVRGTVGAHEQTAAARYGFRIGESGAARVYFNWFDRDDRPQAAFGPVLDDAFQGWQAGFRSDFNGGANHFTLRADVFDNDVDSLPGDGNRGFNILGRWNRALGADKSLQIQAYYDEAERNYLLTYDSLAIFDAEAQFNLKSGRHDLVLGGGVRTTRDEFINNLNPFNLNPQSRRLWVFNAFVQDRIALSPTFSLIAGIKAEETSFTGIALLPNLRVAWQPNDRNLLWAAVSRAVRTPSRIDRQLEFPPLLVGSDFQSEELVAFEAGYRGQPSARTSLSVSVFYNRYDDIRTTELQPGGVFPLELMNGLEGSTWGIETWGSAQVSPRIRIKAGASTLSKDFRVKAGHVDLAARDSLGHDPKLQLFARADLDLTDRVRLNAGLRRIGALAAFAGEPAIPAYVEADANLAWQASDTIELFAAGRNLLHSTHLESNDRQRAQRARRTLFAGARLRF